VTLSAALAARLAGPAMVVGVGNPLCGDDGAGSLLAKRLLGGHGLPAIDAEEVPESFVGDICAARPSAVAFVDAVDFGGAPGDTAILEIADLAPRAATTHHAPLSLVMDVVRRRTGADVFVIAVQPGRRGPGERPTTPVLATVDLLAALLSHAWRGAQPSAPHRAETAGAERPR
jgi:hydrogenase maturation protease